MIESIFDELLRRNDEGDVISTHNAPTSHNSNINIYVFSSLGGDEWSLWFVGEVHMRLEKTHYFQQLHKKWQNAFWVSLMRCEGQYGCFVGDSMYGQMAPNEHKYFG